MDPTEHIAALWQETFGEPPAITADLEMLSRVLVEHLDSVPPYEPKPQAGDTNPKAASRKA